MFHFRFFATRVVTRTSSPPTSGGCRDLACKTSGLGG
jgi:hypothetical protein